MRIFIFILALTTFEVFGQGQPKNGNSPGNGDKAASSVGGSIDNGISGDADLAASAGGSSDGGESGDAASAANGSGTIDGGISGTENSGKAEGRVRGSIDGGVSADTNLDVNGGGSIDGGISGSANAPDMCIQNCMCSCMAQSGISGSGQAKIGVDGQGGVSASGDASLNGPAYNCGSGPIVDTTTAQSGYKYTIDVTRYLTVAPDNDVIYTPPQNIDNQNVTFKKRVDAENPLWITGYVLYGKKEVYTIGNSEAKSACEESKNGNWEQFTVDLMRSTMLPTGTCPVEKGNYLMHIHQIISVTFDEKIKCGDYHAILYADNAEKKWTFQFDFRFTIPDDGNCIQS